MQSELSLKESKSFSDFCKTYSKSYTGKAGWGGATALMGAGLGILGVLFGPVGLAGVAMGALAGGSIGGALGNGVDRKASHDDQYSFLTFYCYTEFLPKFLGISVPEAVTVDAGITRNTEADNAEHTGNDTFDLQVSLHISKLKEGKIFHKEIRDINGFGSIYLNDTELFVGLYTSSKVRVGDTIDAEIIADKKIPICSGTKFTYNGEDGTIGEGIVKNVR